MGAATWSCASVGRYERDVVTRLRLRNLFVLHSCPATVSCQPWAQTLQQGQQEQVPPLAGAHFPTFPPLAIAKTVQRQSSCTDSGLVLFNSQQQLLCLAT
jgi:hypothetical protein